MPLLLTTAAVLKLFLVGAAGFAAVRFRVLDGRSIDGLSRYVIHVSLPCLIIETLSRVLRPELAGTLLLCLLAGAGLIAAGLSLALLLRPLLPPRMRGDGLFLSLSAIQNAGYLPIPLAAALLPEADRAEGLLFTFMHILLMGIVFWSLGVRLISGRARDGRENLRRVLNPPIVTLLLSFLFFVPAVKAAYGRMSVLGQALELLGQSTIPLVLVILGGSLAERPPGERVPLRPVVLSAVIRLLAVPLLALAAIRFLPVDPVFAFVLLLQASMPAATNHIVVVRSYGGDAALTARALLAQYLAAAVTVPLFLAMLRYAP